MTGLRLHSFKTQRRGCNPSKLTPITTTSATPSVASSVLCLCFWLGQFYTGLRSGFVHAVWHNANLKWALLWFNIDPILRLILYVISNLKPAFVIKSKEQICTMKIRFKEKRKDLHSLQKHQPPPLSFSPLHDSHYTHLEPQGLLGRSSSRRRVGVESWASKLVVIAIVSVACLFVFESTMVNRGRSEVWKMR